MKNALGPLLGHWCDLRVRFPVAKAIAPQGESSLNAKRFNTPIRPAMPTRRSSLATNASKSIGIWDTLNSHENLTWATTPPVEPDADGWYPVAIPGTTLPI